MSELILLGVAGAIVGAPVIAVVAFVRARARAREARLAGPWSEIASRWGGSYAPRRVFCDRGDHQLTLEMVLVSVMQAVGNPWYPDGGTFTKMRLALDPRGPSRISDGPPARVDPTEVAARVAAVGALPEGARLVLGEREAGVVLAGTVADVAILDAAARALEAIRESAAANGPFSVR